MFSANPIELLSSLGTVSIVVLVILMFFSVTSWGIIIYKWRMLRVIDLEERHFLRIYDRNPHPGRNEFDKLRRAAKRLPLSPSSTVFMGVINKIDPDGKLLASGSAFEVTGENQEIDRQYFEKVVRYIVEAHINEQETHLSVLATTGNVTPFIGLFGTVVGVINAFSEIGVQGTASIAAVAPGVSEALVATAAGLFAAIPAVIAYNYFLTRIRKSVFSIEAFSIAFLDAIDGLFGDHKEAKTVR